MPVENKHVFELIGDDEFNVKILNETLWDIKEIMFNNLYTAQRRLTNMQRFDFTMNQYSLLTNNECVFNINASFIGNSSRNAFRASRFYKKDLTFDDINSSPNVFNNTIIVFINGELYTNFYIRPLEDITSVVFKIRGAYPSTAEYIRDGFLKSEIRDFVSSEANITIIMLKNHNESYFNTYRGTLRNFVFTQRYLGLPLERFSFTNEIDNDGVFSTWVTDDDSRLYKYKLLSTTLTDNKIYFNENEINALTNDYTYLKNLYLLNQFFSTTVEDGTEYFDVPIRDMPVPIENFIIFKKTDSGLLFDHTTTMTLYYPNIYKVTKDHSNDLLICGFYTDDTLTVGSKYQNELKLYYRFNENILDKYKDNTIPDIIKNYNPITITYDNNDLQSLDVDHLEYKMSTLTNMIRQNGDYYSIYLDKLIGYVPTFDIDVSEIETLTDRIRVNNFTEIADTSNHVEFTEPCYLFKFRHDSLDDKLNVLIDDHQTNDLYISYDEKYTYLYIPAGVVQTNSLITIEKFVDYRYMQNITISDLTTYHEINIPKNQKIHMSDIFVATKSLDNEDIYLSRSDYEVFIKRDDVYEKITTNDFYNYRKIYIKFKNPIDIGTTVKVNVNRVSFKQVVRGSNTVNINRYINNDKRNILLYRNGRLVPQKLRKYEFASTISGPHRIKGVMRENPYDEYTLIYNTNKYFMVYFQKHINSKGIVDLTHKINKPIDFKWYDIYVNGIRLHKSNVEIVSPYVMILKPEVSTLTNLEIYQKNLDSLDWDNNYPTDDIGSQIFDLIKDDVEDQLDDIEDTIPDMFNDKIIDAIDFFDEYLWTNIRLINPDIQQIDQNMIDRFPTTFDDNNNLFINPDQQLALEADVYLNPDTNTILRG